MLRLFAISFVLLSCIVSASGEVYHWPMDAKPALTSTFGEYRGGRLHAAVDLKTWGKEGYPVTAVANGYVWRVRTSPWGYGRVVYVKLNNGLFALWAHLSGFSERIEKYVREEQDRHGTYSVNLFFRPDQLPVKRGEVVGFSGSTGIGVPHLHFELRNAKQHPINPLLHGLEVKDTVPPTLQAIGLAPLDAYARVNGQHDPKAFALAWHGRKKRFTHPDTVAVWGRIGVGFKVFDRADASELTNRLAPYQMRLLVDGEEVFKKTLSEFGYDVTHHGELAFDYFMNRRGLGRFHSLYRKFGNQLPFYGNYEIDDGVLFAGKADSDDRTVLLPGVHEVQVVAEDVEGNRSMGTLFVRVVQEPEIEALKVVWSDQAVQVVAQVFGARRVLFEQSEDDGKTWAAVGKWRDVRGQVVRHTMSRASLFRMRIQGARGLEAFQTFGVEREDRAQMIGESLYYPTFAVVRLKVNRVLAVAPTVVLKGDQKPLVVRQTGLRTYEVVVAFDEEKGRDISVEVEAEEVRQSLYLTQQRVTRKEGGEVFSDDGSVRVRFEKNGVYQTLFGRVVADSAAADERMVGPAFRIMPEDVALERAELAFVYPKDYAEVDKLGIYEWNDKKGWVFVDMGRDSVLGAVTGEVKHFGLFAMLIDNVPPQITKVIPADGAAVTVRQPKVVASVKDASSGIWREEDIVMRIDGRALIVEYDPEEDLIFATPRKPLSSGMHQFEVVVRDICGNEARSRSSFRVK
jgi:hypothetical protein